MRRAQAHDVRLTFVSRSEGQRALHDFTLSQLRLLAKEFFAQLHTIARNADVISHQQNAPP